jgi:hypothetical protein
MFSILLCANDSNAGFFKASCPGISFVFAKVHGKINALDHIPSRQPRAYDWMHVQYIIYVKLVI